MTATALQRASDALTERRYDAALAAAEEALAGPLDLDVPDSERGEIYEHPERALALHCKGTALSELGRRKEAIDALTEALFEHPRRYYTLHNRGVARRDEGDLAGALDDLTAALAIYPGYGQARVNRADTYARLGRWAEAQADLAIVLASDPRAEPARSLWDAARKACEEPHDDAALAAVLAGRA